MIRNKNCQLACWRLESMSGVWCGQNSVRILSRQEEPGQVHEISSRSFRRNTKREKNHVLILHGWTEFISHVGSTLDLLIFDRNRSHCRRIRFHVWDEHDHPYCGSLASRVFFLSHCRRDIHSQDHGRSDDMYKNTQTNTVM